LHYAASNDDLDVAEAMIDGGADLEAPAGSIGTPLDNAVGYGCWHVARLLVNRGASVDKAWHAAALGMLARLEAILGGDPPAENKLGLTRPAGRAGGGSGSSPTYFPAEVLSAWCRRAKMAAWTRSCRPSLVRMLRT
jgi:hypothetical protein